MNKYCLLSSKVSIVNDFSTCPYCGITQNCMDDSKCEHIIEADFTDLNNITMIYEPHGIDLNH